MSGGFPVPEYNNREAFFGYFLPCAQLKEGGILPDCHILFTVTAYFLSEELNLKDYIPEKIT